MLFHIHKGLHLKGSKVKDASRVLSSVHPRRSRSTYNDYEYMQQSSLPTMYFQASLPRLPIPKLADTCRRYLKAQEPILSSEEFKRTTSNVALFQSKEGPQLHKKLLESDANNKHTSYISKPWFDTYLTDRKPLPVNYNPFLVMMQEDEAEYNKPLVKATNLLISSARFIRSLRAGIMEPEVFHMNPKKSDTKLFRLATGLLPSGIATYGAYLFKAYPLDMSQFHHLFGTTRIPEIDKDRIYNNPTSRHVIAMRRGHFYSFDLFNEDNTIRSPCEIASCVNSILNDPQELNQCPIGILTTTERNQWAKERQHLLKLGNERILEKIDTALFVLALDTDFDEEDHNMLSRQMLYSTGTNRWFDKSFSLIVTGNGFTGLNFEHSWGDGVAILRYFTNLKKDIRSRPRFHPKDVHELPTSPPRVEKLHFNLDDAIRTSVDRAIGEYKRCTHDRISLDHHMSDLFGKKQCKTFGVSPDAVMQVAFQLALYKQEKRAVATYESCSTSAFKHGRTETIRSCTNETKALCKAIVEKGISEGNINEYKKLMLECSKTHTILTKEAAMGQGFDRHLFALKGIAEQTLDGHVPLIFQDPSYTKLNQTILSTSTLSSPDVIGGGFGPVVDDGYGIAYMILDEKLGTITTSYKNHRDASEYINHIQLAFEDLHRILQSK